VAAEALGAQAGAHPPADEACERPAQQGRDGAEQGRGEMTPAVRIDPAAPHADEIEVILEQTLKRQGLRALLAAEITIEVDAAGAHEVLDDQAAVGDNRAVVIDDERQLSLGALCRIDDRHELVRQAGEAEPCLELEGERADVAPRTPRGIDAA
jgi:hypothetical protein